MKKLAPSTIQKVLSIALRLAAPPALIACSLQPVATDTSGPAPISTTPDPTPTCTPAHLVRSESLPDAAEKQSCEDTLAAAVADEFGPDYNQSERSWYDSRNYGRIRDPASKACCEPLAKDPSKTTEFRSMQCCLVDVNPQSHCTPWGPPMPTAMA